MNDSSWYLLKHTHIPCIEFVRFVSAHSHKSAITLRQIVILLHFIINTPMNGEYGYIE